MLWPPRVAVVTGANRGLGLSLAECLAESGTHVVLAARDEQLCTAAATALATAKGVSVEAVQLDVQCGRSIEAFGAYCEQTFGGVDLLVNNAAVCEAGWSEAAVRRSLRTNVLGPRALTRRLLPSLRQRPHGQVLHVSSGDGELLYLSPELQRQMAAVDSERTRCRVENKLAEPSASRLSGSSSQRQTVLQAALRPASATRPLGPHRCGPAMSVWFPIWQARCCGCWRRRAHRATPSATRPRTAPLQRTQSRRPRSTL